MDEALRIARGLSRDPDSVRPYHHDRLQNARHGRGHAFLDSTGYLLVLDDGGYALGLLPDGGLPEVIDKHLAAHRHRELADDELGPSQRLAVAAFDAGTEIPEHADPATADHARYLLIAMRRRGTAGRAALARDDALLRPPTPGRRYTHPCPFCARPALHQDRYPLAVCDACHERTTDSSGRRIMGSNIDMSGGFVAHYADPPREVCVEVTRTGRCAIDGRPARIGEARFGGVVVEAVVEAVADVTR